MSDQLSYPGRAPHLGPDGLATDGCPHCGGGVDRACECLSDPWRECERLRQQLAATSRELSIMQNQLVSVLTGDPLPPNPNSQVEHVWETVQELRQPLAEARRERDEARLAVEQLERTYLLAVKDSEAERDAALAVLREAQPFVFAASQFDFGPRGLVAYRLLARIAAALEGK